MKTVITDEMLESLRASLAQKMGEKRYRHTLGVEKEAQALARIFAPEYETLLRAAALLHDLTKEYTPEKQLQICSAFGIMVDEFGLLAPKTFHAVTAAALIPSEYPDFADPLLIRAVRSHTTGSADMNICDRILYIADYTEEGRTFDDCVRLRKYLWDGLLSAADAKEKAEHFGKTLLLSFDMTIEDLIKGGKVIARQTNDARNAVIAEMNNNK